MENMTSRRAVIGATLALPVMGLTVAGVATAEASGADAEIIRQWNIDMAALRELHGDWGEILQEDEERRYFALEDVRDKAEAYIQKAEPVTIRGAIVQLWVAFNHTCHEKWAEEALARRDEAEIFANVHNLDFDCQMIVRAIIALDKIEKGGRR